MTGLVCDNYKFCEQATDYDVEVARARGWHMYEGPTYGGWIIRVVLCPHCMGNRRRHLAPEVLEGQEELF